MSLLEDIYSSQTQVLWKGAELGGWSLYSQLKEARAQAFEVCFSPMHFVGKFPRSLVFSILYDPKSKSNHKLMLPCPLLNHHKVHDVTGACRRGLIVKGGSNTPYPQQSTVWPQNAKLFSVFFGWLQIGRCWDRSVMEWITGSENL